MALQPRRYRFTTADYYRMAEAGILNEDSRVELIGGEVLEMSPIGRRHVASVNRLNDLLPPLVRHAAIISVQNPIQLDEHNEPEPDLALLHRRADYYASGHPAPQDVLLIVEVADSSIEYDRQTKAPLYARFGIPELWIVDLTRDHIAVSREPTSAGYATTRVYRRGESISPLALPDLRIAVDDILG
jgi:Uma2 family endonuclease